MEPVYIPDILFGPYYADSYSRYPTLSTAHMHSSFSGLLSTRSKLRTRVLSMESASSMPTSTTSR